MIDEILQPDALSNQGTSNLASTNRSITQVRPSVVDDYIRNFLIKAGMTRTLDAFNTEWYELKSKGKLAENLTLNVPDIYLKNQELDGQVTDLRIQVEQMKEVADKAQSTWDKFIYVKFVVV